MQQFKFMTKGHWRVFLKSADGSIDLGEWAKKEGGEKKSEAELTRPGGMQPYVAIPGGPPMPEEVTMTRQFDQVRDLQGAYATIDQRCVGRGVVFDLIQIPLDYDGQAIAQPLTQQAIITGLGPLDTDSDSNERNELSVTLQPFGA